MYIYHRGKKMTNTFDKVLLLSVFLQGWYYCVTLGNSNLLKKVNSGNSLTSEMGSCFSSAAVGITVCFTCSSQKAQLGQEGTCGRVSLIAEVVTLFFFVRRCNTQLKWPFKRSRAVRSISGLSWSNPFWLSVEILFICRVWICCSW